MAFSKPEPPSFWTVATRLIKHFLHFRGFLNLESQLKLINARAHFTNITNIVVILKQMR